MIRTLRTLTFLAVAPFLLGLSAVAAAESPQSSKGADHNRKGIQYFDEAFYRELPKGRQRKADELFDLAAAEFRQAIAADHGSVAAHRNLARVYYVRKDFQNAADAYKRVTVLNPVDIDAYVQLALCYTHVNRFAEAVAELENAKTQTADPQITGKLEQYIRNIRERQ